MGRQAAQFAAIRGKKPGADQGHVPNERMKWGGAHLSANARKKGALGVLATCRALGGRPMTSAGIIFFVFD